MKYRQRKKMYTQSYGALGKWMAKRRRTFRAGEIFSMYRDLIYVCGFPSHIRLGDPQVEEIASNQISVTVPFLVPVDVIEINTVIRSPEYED
jgi:hypothetical protein